MRLIDCLNYADIDTLRAIADHYQLSCTRHSKMSLHQAITYHFRMSSFISEQLQRWSQHRTATWLRLYSEAKRPYSLEELRSWFTDDDDIQQALREGWLFRTSRFQYSQPQYVVPEELHSQISAFVAEKLCGQLVFSGEGPLVYADEESFLLQDVDVFLEYVQNHDVPLTQDGTIYKRHLLRLLEIMRVSEDPLAGGWRFGYGRRFHDYPNRFAFLYDFAFHKGYVEEGAGGSLIVTGESRGWLDAADGLRLQWMADFYVATYRRAIPRLPTILRLLSMTQQRWVQEESMYNAAGVFINKYYYDSSRDVWELRILKMLQHLGLIRRGKDESDTGWFQTTQIGQQLLATGEMTLSTTTSSRQQVLIVQPNFNILVTAHQPATTAQLAQIAKLWETGALQVYRLNQDSFCKGLGGQRDGLQWIQFLQTHSQTAIPGNVEKTLLDWERIWQEAQSPLTS